MPAATRVLADSLADLEERHTRWQRRLALMAGTLPPPRQSPLLEPHSPPQQRKPSPPRPLPPPHSPQPRSRESLPPPPPSGQLLSGARHQYIEALLAERSRASVTSTYARNHRIESPACPQSEFVAPTKAAPLPPTKMSTKPRKCQQRGAAAAGCADAATSAAVIAATSASDASFALRPQQKARPELAARSTPLRAQRRHVAFVSADEFRQVLAARVLSPVRTGSGICAEAGVSLRALHLGACGWDGTPPSARTHSLLLSEDERDGLRRLRARGLLSLAGRPPAAGEPRPRTVQRPPARPFTGAFVRLQLTGISTPTQAPPRSYACAGDYTGLASAAAGWKESLRADPPHPARVRRENAR